MKKFDLEQLIDLFKCSFKYRLSNIEIFTYKNFLFFLSYYDFLCFSFYIKSDISK